MTTNNLELICESVENMQPSLLLQPSDDDINECDRKFQLAEHC